MLYNYIIGFQCVKTGQKQVNKFDSRRDLKSMVEGSKLNKEEGTRVFILLIAANNKKD
jgi:hypothetical protein